jgi:Ras-related protein Rab-8A
VGKTSLMRRFTEDAFSSAFVSTIGIDFRYKVVTRNERKVRLEIWDTAGQERFKSITTSYLRGAQGILIVYDVTDRTSFQRVDAWLHDIQQYAELHVDRVLVGSKCDMVEKRVVLEEEGRALAQAHGLAFFEASAKSNIGVAAPFDYLCTAVLARLGASQSKAQGGVKLGDNIKSGSIASGQQQQQQAGGCCG